MKKNTLPRDAMILNRAAFRVERRSLGSVELLDRLLAQVVGGAVDSLPTTCTEFVCNVYAPPPPAEG